MGITGVTACVIKMPSSPTTIFVSFNVRLMDPKPMMKSYDEKYEERSEEYRKYLIARDYQTESLKRQSEEVKKLSRSEAGGPKLKSN